MVQAKNKPATEDDTLSALADGQALPHEVAAACQAWRDDERQRERWHAYHLIGDSLRSQELASAPQRDEAFLAALRQRLAAEPVVLAPAAVAPAHTPYCRRPWPSEAKQRSAARTVEALLDEARFEGCGLSETEAANLVAERATHADRRWSRRPSGPRWTPMWWCPASAALARSLPSSCGRLESASGWHGRRASWRTACACSPTRASRKSWPLRGGRSTRVGWSPASPPARTWCLRSCSRICAP